MTLTRLFCVLSICMSTGDCSVCSEEAKRLLLPVASFCSGGQIEGNPVILDGYHLNTLNNVNNCTCVVKAPFDKQTARIIYQDIDSISSPVQNNIKCGSIVLLRRSQETQELRCQIGGFFSINGSEDVLITLIKERDPKDTRYCFKIFADSGDAIKLVCHIPDTYELTTNDLRSETIEASTLIMNINNSTALHNTDFQFITTQNAGNDSFQFTGKVQHGNKGSSTKVYIGIGGGTVALLTALIVGIVCLRKTRKREQSARGPTEQSYTDLGTRELKNRYSTIHLPQHHYQEYERAA